MIIAGSFVLGDVTEFDHFVEGRAIAMPVILIIIGIIVFIVASLGCYGAIKESPTLLMAFALFLAIIFIVELAIGIAAVVYRTELQNELRKSLETTIWRSSREDKVAWDHVQRKLQCCGVMAQSDWFDLIRNKTGQTIPASCCRPQYIDEKTNDCTNAAPNYYDRYFNKGCMPFLEEKIGDNTKILIGVGIGISFIQLLGIFLACWLASRIRHENAK